LSPSRGYNYSLDEIAALADGWEELREHNNKAWILVRMIDIQRAIHTLDRPHQEAVLLVGFLGLSSRSASTELGVSHTTVSRRYAEGIAKMAKFLNGIQ